MNTSLDRTRVLLSIQRALLGAITPSMRLIDACWNEKQIQVRIVADSQSDTVVEDIANEIEAEIEGDFLPHATVRVVVERATKDAPVTDFKPSDGQCARVFSRRSD